MTVASTSAACYREIKSEGLLTHRQQQIMDVIKPGRDYSLQEIVMLCGLPINVVSGRVNELKRDLKRLEHGETRQCSLTRRTIHPVRIPEVQGSLFA